MIQGVAHQIFAQFSNSVKARLESASSGAESESNAAAPEAATELRILPILLQTVTAAISRFVRKLFGRSTPER